MSSESHIEYSNEDRERLKTPITFAEWRLNHFKKTVGIDIIDRTIGTIIDFVRAFLGQNNDSSEWGNVLRVIVPSAIYVSLIIVTIGNNAWFSGKLNFNIYRILALMLLYIISYSELNYLKFLTIFLLGIVFEMVFIILQMGSEES
jgi:hypothetical protein